MHFANAIREHVSESRFDNALRKRVWGDAVCKRVAEHTLGGCVLTTRLGNAFPQRVPGTRFQNASQDTFPQRVPSNTLSIRTSKSRSQNAFSKRVFKTRYQTPFPNCLFKTRFATALGNAFWERVLKTRLGNAICKHVLKTRVGNVL